MNDNKIEQAIIDSFENDEWIATPNLEQRQNDLTRYAQNTIKKDKRLNIRISERDLMELQRRAMKEGIPYQTYVAGILHKFINGTLPDSINR